MALKKLRAHSQSEVNKARRSEKKHKELQARRQRGLLHGWFKLVLRRSNVEKNELVLRNQLEERTKQRVFELWSARALEEKSSLYYRERMLTQAINKLKVLRALDTMRGSLRLTKKRRKRWSKGRQRSPCVWPTSTRGWA